MKRETKPAVFFKNDICLFSLCIGINSEFCGTSLNIFLYICGFYAFIYWIDFVFFVHWLEAQWHDGL